MSLGRPECTVPMEAHGKEISNDNCPRKGEGAKGKVEKYSAEIVGAQAIKLENHEMKAKAGYVRIEELIGG